MISTLVPPEATYPPKLPPGPTTVDGWLLIFAGMSADEIAAEFRKSGILGTPCDPEDCGLARFFKQVLGLQRVRVTGTAMAAYEIPRVWELPRSCTEFVCKFDNGSYPWLYRAGTWPRRPQFIEAHAHQADALSYMWAPLSPVLPPPAVPAPPTQVIKFVDAAMLAKAFGVPASVLEVPELVGA